MHMGPVPTAAAATAVQVLAAAGVAARRACEELILKGAVKVNGQVVWQGEMMACVNREGIG